MRAPFHIPTNPLHNTTLYTFSPNSNRIPGEIRLRDHIQYYRYLATGLYLADVGIFREKKKKKKSCTGSLCAHMHGSVLPVPVLCLGILPMVRDKSISFGRLWVAINKSKGFGRLWVAIDLSLHDV